MRDHRLPTDKSGENVHPSYLQQRGKHCDGAGLYLEVAVPGQASWMFRHKAGWRSIGSANGYSIREAREVAAKLWTAARKGEDPFALLASLRAPKAGEEPKGKLFSEAMSEYLAAKSPHWAASNRARELRRYHFLFDQIPDFTSLRLLEIDQTAKNKALATWNGKEKARRDASFYIEAIIRYAKTGKLRIVGHKPKQQHHEAMPYASVPAFYKTIAAMKGDDARALAFLILTGARTDEVIGHKRKDVWLKARPTWSEITTIDGKPVWAIPGSTDDEENFRGMKGKADHNVPLSSAAVAVLGERRADRVPLFKASHNSALLAVLRKHHDGFTVHGFRSSFSDWAIEQGYSRDLADMCIAHGEERNEWVDPKTRKAYQRSGLLKLRHEVFQQWAAFVTGGS
jgi:integrase